MRIALDVMGGDHAPQSNVEGALQAIKEDPLLTVVLVGNEQAIRAHLPAEIPAGIEIRGTTEVIEAEDEPVKAVRRKKDASLVVAVNLAKEQQVETVISAGNTGALMTAGLLIAGRMPGIERPALVALIPTLSGKITLALDVGANMDAKPVHLLQYAVMGSLYAEKVLGFEQARVGLLNVGTEAAKGNELSKATFPLLSKANVNFIGNVEARDLMQGACDVLVCDGFVGNVLLKAAEGVATSIFSRLKKELTSGLLNKMAALILKPSLYRFKNTLDYAEYGGAPLLGLRYPIFKAHGSSDARAIKNAILAAARFVKQDVNSYIQQELNKEIYRESE
ncbi:phosphate acyltransferase PlsX [Brevibacillus fulvus]|uniref:Phosphate acyltransferase n=1 Tax=Brevibacillus fulvus TaxID=1125967 RepID=A0A939BNQ7_9BACL|nr:phosphate acyltransferase PlsX [Brevibacillus fulvus]MBM7589470.1 glycerol-3-phosphate acyltransferase PlsX [Brevibacillus fulvus]